MSDAHSVGSCLPRSGCMLYFVLHVSSPPGHCPRRTERAAQLTAAAAALQAAERASKWPALAFPGHLPTASARCGP